MAAGRTHSYAELLAAADLWVTRLEVAGLGPGSTVAIEGDFTFQSCALLLALLKNRCIAVPLARNVRAERPAYEALAEVQATIVFDTDDQHQLVSHGRRVQHTLLRTLQERGHPGLVIFSSGSSGQPKAVVHDFDALLRKFVEPKESKTVMLFLLFDHIGGLDTFFGALSSTGCVVTVDQRTPERVCELLAQHQVHTLPTTPTFLNLLLISQAAQQHDLSHLKVIAYGTEAMPQTTLKRLQEALPTVKLVQTYGMSEVGVLRSRSRPDGSTWLQFRNDSFQTKVVDGVLWVKAPTAMLGYLNAPDLFDAEGWLNTQDAVEIDGDYMRVLGRVSDLINVSGQKVYPAEVEGVLLQMPNVKDASVRGEKSPLTGNFVTATVSLENAEPVDELRRRLKAFCRERLAAYKIPVRIEVVDQVQFSARFKKTRK